MKIFIAGLITETNTFSPIPTGYANYKETALYHGDATAHAPTWASGILHTWKNMAAEIGATLVESLFAMAQPAGPTVESVYCAFRDEILSDLKQAGDVDIVLLSLHGAMVVKGIDDAEGRLLEDVRALVGDGVPIGVELDSHGHLSERILKYATIPIFYKEYPHVDMNDRAREVFQLCMRVRLGEISPVLSVQDCGVIGVWPTTSVIMRRFIAKMKQYERRSFVLSVSFAHSFPWADVSYMGSKILVITDDKAGLGAIIAQEFADDIWDTRYETGIAYRGVSSAIEAAAIAQIHPVVLADTADNPGGGAPGDNTVMLGAILKAGLPNAVVGSFWDPIAVELCKASGVGSKLFLRLGGKCGPSSGEPLDLTVEVRAIAENAVQTFGELSVQMGDCVWVSCDGTDILINSTRTQILSTDAFTQMGMVLADYDTIVVKSMHHFHAAFEAVAADIIYVTSPGALSLDFKTIVYKQLRRPLWPLVDDPFLGSERQAV